MINNANTINFITKNISKNIFHKKSWKFYLYNFLCFSPFIIYITFLSLINHKISSLQNNFKSVSVFYIEGESR